MRASKSKKLSKKKADKYFSLFIRKRDENKPCVTCGKFTSYKDAGHFISREKESTRYDERNAHGQCLSCNRFKSGLQFEHGKAIDNMYGKGASDSLWIKSKMRSFRKQSDYERIAKKYKEKLEEIG